MREKKSTFLTIQIEWRPRNILLFISFDFIQSIELLFRNMLDISIILINIKTVIYMV